MNENVEVRFSRLERAPAYKTVVAPWLAITIGGCVRRKAREKYRSTERVARRISGFSLGASEKRQKIDPGSIVLSP
jgi:hypothetical protein